MFRMQDEYMVVESSWNKIKKTVINCCKFDFYSSFRVRGKSLKEVQGCSQGRAKSWKCTEIQTGITIHGTCTDRRRV